VADSRSIVLVHGAWHGPWAWSRVAGPLRERGFDVHTVANPSSGSDPTALRDLYDDADNLRRTLAGLGDDVLVVAHSYGGIVATEGAAGAANVSHLLYVTAFMLDEGASLLSTVGGEAPDWWVRDEDGLSTTVSRAEEIFFNDCSPEDAADAASRLEPQSLPSFEQPVRSVAWRDIPSSYLICERDNAIPPVLQEQLAERAGDVRRVEASHSPFLSRPGEVAELIAELAS
jgi:pimeloyl-ACP methyl ester carboxylesterase